MDFGQIGDFFSGIVDYFSNFEASVLYKFGAMVVAYVMLVVEIVKGITG